MGYLFLLIAVLLIAGLIYLFTRTTIPELLHASWAHFFPEFQFSTQEFYSLVETKLKDWKVPEASISKVVFSERGAFSRSREYLRVKNGPYSFDICAAPYGTGFFVSWWFGEDLGCLMRMLSYIPIVGRILYIRAHYKTYYVMDTEAMFREAVRLAVMESIDSITQTKGIRMSDADRQYKSNRV